MKLKRIQTVFLLILCAVMIAVGFSVTVRADMGPKPSVRIRFENMGDELCYGTLLSKTKSTGPASAWDGVESHAKHSDNKSYSYADFDYEIWKVAAQWMPGIFLDFMRGSEPVCFQLSIPIRNAGKDQECSAGNDHAPLERDFISQCAKYHHAGRITDGIEGIHKAEDTSCHGCLCIFLYHSSKGSLYDG